MLVRNADIVFGSRIKKADTNIERSLARHLVGRTIATVIDRKLKLGYYDTQCGAKMFFDVELFMRLKKHEKELNIFEIPLSSWHNVKDSKLNALSFPVVIKEIYILLTKY